MLKNGFQTSNLDTILLLSDHMTMLSMSMTMMKKKTSINVSTSHSISIPLISLISISLEIVAIFSRLVELMNFCSGI